jgi:opacity protein-like surface antigen
MKVIYSLLLAAVALPAVGGTMGPQASQDLGSTYIMIGGGYANADYQSNFTGYTSGALTGQGSFNDVYQNGYGQIGIGADARWGTLNFDHQVVAGKLGGTESFTTRSSLFQFRQNVDFGYDVMPKMNLMSSLNAFGILGVHYGRFSYLKTPIVTGESNFNAQRDQIGFNLGAGLEYRVTPNFGVGVKYQHWQYKSTTVSGSDLAGSDIDVENITPAFNLAGVELRYYWN